MLWRWLVGMRFGMGRCSGRGKFAIIDTWVAVDDISVSLVGESAAQAGRHEGVLLRILSRIAAPAFTVLQATINQVINTSNPVLVDDLSFFFFFQACLAHTTSLLREQRLGEDPQMGSWSLKPPPVSPLSVSLHLTLFRSLRISSCFKPHSPSALPLSSLL